MVFKLWLDDIRPAPASYIRARSVDEAKAIIHLAEALGYTEFFLDLDHDLGEYASYGGDGIKLVDWLDETGRHYNIKIHSMNPVGVANMQRIINRW